MLCRSSSSPHSSSCGALHAPSSTCSTKHFQNALDISITQSALIQVTTYLGYFLMAIPAGLFINRQGYRRGVVSGLLLFGLGSLAFIPCSMLGTFYAYLVALFIIGCGLVFLETSANPVRNGTSDRRRQQRRVLTSRSRSTA